MTEGPMDVVEVGVDEQVKVELGNGVREVVKRKRGRPPRALAIHPPSKPVTAKPPPVKKIEEEDEDVCFICFDDGSLVLCDHRACPPPAFRR